jgi:hypothetical protein
MPAPTITYLLCPGTIATLTRYNCRMGNTISF